MGARAYRRRVDRDRSAAGIGAGTTVAISPPGDDGGTSMPV